MSNFEFKENEFEAKFSLYVTGKQVLSDGLIKLSELWLKYTLNIFLKLIRLKLQLILFQIDDGVMMMVLALYCFRVVSTKHFNNQMFTIISLNRWIYVNIIKK